jgi:hypothetical protein
MQLVHNMSYPGLRKPDRDIVKERKENQEYEKKLIRWRIDSEWR